MMERLAARGGEIASTVREREVRRVAQRLRALFGSGAVEVLDAQLLVNGRGLLKRWLYDPSLRFLMGELK